MALVLRKSRRGFTLVEIMIVVALIALLATIAMPNYLRARKRAQASRILNDLRVIDHAMVLWTADNAKKPGDVATLADLQGYMKPTDTPLYYQGLDLFGHSYEPFVSDVTPKVDPQTFAELELVAPAEFWSPYK